MVYTTKHSHILISIDRMIKTVTIKVYYILYLRYVQQYTELLQQAIN